MLGHLRANLILVVATLLLCCVVYPAILLGIGHVFFRDQAEGSLIRDADGKVIGSRLIAQPFTKDEYLWPRPSAAGKGFDASASGASNWGASNPRLRDRVCQQLGPMVQYRKKSRSAGDGSEPRTPQQDIEAWFAKEDRVTSWAADSSVAPANWATTDKVDDKYGLQGEYILAWAKTHSEVIDEWKKANPKRTDDPKPEDLVTPFFASFARANPRKWPGVVEVKQPNGQTTKRIEPVSSDVAIHANFFDLWLSDPANQDKAADLELVPADMVTASGSGLDPHVTLDNARYQLQHRIVAARAKLILDKQLALEKEREPDADPRKLLDKLRDDIQMRLGKPLEKHIEEGLTDVMNRQASAPLGGLVGVELVNVLEFNRKMDTWTAQLSRTLR
jgi:potassium-transporting ATPase KdpC subunit